ncbi:Oviduct-specific glycoprotein [Hypsizygus marmoreus]|uniref:Oviduct-specific glycoprotein n=1 Tax=Hypsizygus marmoreus TaxID=39966 RepID=A0A369JFT6_HYPMA|nr:Oviduct-specific glycoprotein [Hypsizygus marmoreus]
MAPLITINNHTTASSPRPHILYTVQVTLNGRFSVVQRRYSEFVALHETLKDTFTLPPKRLLATTFIPSAWVDDTLIAERKAGLTQYISELLKSPEYKDAPALLDFLTAADSGSQKLKFDLEDAVPSTLSRKAAMNLNLDDEDDVGVEATPIAAAYYVDWAAGSFPPEKLDFSKFDILFFAFATPSSSSGINFGSGSQAILKRLATAAHNSGKGTKVVLSVGGWGGCQYFSSACSSSANRTKFVTALKSAVTNNGLDGIDLDWEYPNSPGAGQPYSSADAANLLSLIKSLRTSLGTSKVISAAVPHLPWLGSNGSALKDASAYASQMTYVNIMNYDVWGASSNPGPNSPLGNLCGTSKQPQASAQAALSQWKAAGFPASKILLGIPLYGYVSQSTKKVLTGSLLPSSDMLLLQKEEVPAGTIDALEGAVLRQDPSAPEMTTPVYGEMDVNFLNGSHARPTELKTVEGEVDAAAANLQSWWGQQIPFNAIKKSGALVKKSDGNYGEGGGFTMGWDNCSDTPYLFNVSQKTVVTYDDTWSIADKAKWAKQNGLAGCFTWSLDQDDGLTLQNVIRKNLGK